MSVDWIVAPEQRQEIEPHLTVALRYLPPWVRSLTVRYDPTEENLASVGVQPEYRTAAVRVGDGWFSESHAERRIAMVHEVLHAHLQTLAVVFADLLAAMEPDDALRRWAEEQWRRAEEGVCTDLADVLTAAGADG